MLKNKCSFKHIYLRIKKQKHITIYMEYDGWEGIGVKNIEPPSISSIILKVSIIEDF